MDRKSAIPAAIDIWRSKSDRSLGVDHLLSVFFLVTPRSGLRPITTSTGTSPLLPTARRKRLHLVHQVLYTHDETFHTYLNQGRHQLFPSSMLTVQLARKTYLPVRWQHHQTTRSLASCPPASLISSLA